MKGELEPIRQEFLDHILELRHVGNSRLVGFAGEIEAVRFEPGRAAGDLAGMEAIGERDEVVQSGICRGEEIGSTPSHENRSAARLGPAWFDGGDLEGWVRISGHQLRRRRRFGNRPLGRGSSTHEIQGRGRTSLGPGSGDRIFIRAQLSLKLTADRGDRHLQGGTLLSDRSGVDGPSALVDAVHDGLEAFVIGPRDFDDNPQGRPALRTL